MPFSINNPNEDRACFTLSTKSPNIPNMPASPKAGSVDSLVVEITEPFSFKAHISADDSVVVDKIPNSP